MKKTLLFVACCFACLSLFAQDLTLTFTAKTEAGAPVRMKKIEVKNLTKDWMETLVYPDTILTLPTDGVQDYLNDPDNMMLQNIPNPFNGVTDVMLNMAENDRIFMEIHDVNGKLVQSCRQQLSAGMHVFHITLNVPQTYMLSVKTKYHKATVKMVNLKSGGQNQIDYRGNADMMSYNLLKKKSDQKFDIGDEMAYQGYTMVDGSELKSEVVNKTLTGSELITLIFSYKPEISDVTVSDITYHSAKLSAEVISSPTEYVQKKGFCYAITENPTLNDSVVELGRGLGSMECVLEHLKGGEKYYVCAYIVRSDSTYYGNVTSFNTVQESAPTVITDSVSNIEYYAAVCGGEVTATGGYDVLSRGVCWSKEDAPTLKDEHTSDGQGLGSFTSDLTGLESQTKYYVRAYAVNELGVAYGDVMEFSTSDKELAVVATADVSGISSNAAVGGGNVTFDGAAKLQECGVCWSTAENPTVDGAHAAAAEAKLGEFTVTLNDLTSNTNYYVRAYVMNEVGVAYGENKTFTTKDKPFATLTTAEVTDITRHVAVCGGEVISDAGAAVTRRGVCWSTNAEPTVADAHTEDGAGLGTFVSVMKEMLPNTTYFVRAYAENVAGVSYGQQREFKTAEFALPDVKTLHADNITRFTATVYGNVTCEEGVEVMERGICFDTTATPMVDGSEKFVIPAGMGVGDFSVDMAELEPNTKYYYRAYGATGAGLAYGETDSFKTHACSAPEVTIISLTDITANSALLQVSVTDDGGSYLQNAGSCWSEYGIPSVDDTLSTYVINQAKTAYRSALKNLKPNTKYYVRAWAQNSCTEAGEVGEQYGVYGYSEVKEFITTPVQLPEVVTLKATDVTTASAKLHGDITDANGGTITKKGFCWSVNPDPEIGKEGCLDKQTTFYALVEYSDVIDGLQPGTTYYYKAFAISEAGIGYGAQESLTTLPVTAPEVVTNPMTGVSARAANGSGTVTYDGGADVTARGLCWSTDTLPTIADNVVEGGKGKGSFTCTIAGLTPNTTYYVRAYATNVMGTTYGAAVSFTTLEELDEFVCGKSTIKDVDGNEYYTVQIGFQCWMKENMRARHFADGTEIAFKVCSKTNFSDPACYTTDAVSEAYGLFYNKAAYMNGAKNSDAEPSGVQGVCPTGWHVPSKAECQRMVKYITPEHYDVCQSSGAKTGVAKALAAPSDWASSTAQCTPGNDCASNNVSGFTMYASGIFLARTSLDDASYIAYLVTSSISSGEKNTLMSIYNTDYAPSFTRNTTAYPYSQIPVRCLKDYSPDDITE